MKAVTPLRAVVLLSGSGTTFQNLREVSRTGALALDIVGVISSKPGAYGLTRARSLGVPAQVVNRKDYMDVTSFSREIFRLVGALKPDLIVMAGFISKLHLADRFIGRTINIHPSLLPRFGGKGMYGSKVHEAVLHAKAKESGCTVHYVDNEYDSGPVILQKTVPVEADDTPQTLQERVQIVEREAYPEAINMIADGRVKYEDGKAIFPEER